jgi:hypothetical protein
MQRCNRANGLTLGLILLLGAVLLAGAQNPAAGAPVLLTVVDENDLPVPDAQVVLSEPGSPPVQLRTDSIGRCAYLLHQESPYQLRVEKPGFYQTLESQVDPARQTVKLALTHEAVVQQQIDVVASTSGIDPEQTSDSSVLNIEEITNVPYPTSRDIRNLLPFNPGVVQDSAGQTHVAGSPTYATLDVLDGFDIRSPVSGALAMRVSADAVRSIDTQSTRYPVEFGRATGGVVAFYTGMGDNKFHFNATDFVPSVRNLNGLRFDKLVPRVTFSGPLARNRAWFLDGLEMEYDDIYIPGLPLGADSNRLLRGSNLTKFQVNLPSANILSAGLIVNGYHSPYDGISILTPQMSTTRNDSPAWLPYVREQHTFSGGALLDVATGAVHFRDGYEPHGNSPYQITPETSQGSYFENAVAHSNREETTAALYLPARSWLGRHELKAGAELGFVGFDESVSRAPISYLREDTTKLRQSVFPQQAPFSRHNLEAGLYLQDHWLARPGLVVEPGLRFDWDEILRRPLFSPRLAFAYSPPGAESTTKLSAGIGLYYEHTQLEVLERALAGVRYDTSYAADGKTPLGAPTQVVFTANDASSLTQMRALNWSVGLERKLPGSLYVGANFMQKRASDGFTYALQGVSQPLQQTYLLTNQRQDHYYSAEFNARRTFANGYTLFASYTHSSARTNAALDYMPTLSVLGPQQSGPLTWDTPNRVVSWGWLPLLLPKLKKSWDFVYTLDVHSGFPFTAVDANQTVVGPAGGQRFPEYVSFSPGLEWRFHLRGSYFGLRGVLENATNSSDPYVVNNNVDSPAYGTFTEPLGRAFTTRIRLIGTK